MYKLKKISFVLFLILLFVGCSDDFLNVASREEIEAEDSSENYTPDEFVIGVYGSFTDFTYAFSWLGVTEIISDNADKGSSPSDTGTDKHLLDNLEFSSTTPSIESVWTKWYKTIGRATYAIEYTENFEMSDEQLRSRLIGEAKFLRAVCYFYLVRYFGDVPIQEQDLTQRAPQEEVYQYIIADLESAAEVLPEKGVYAEEDLGRATRGAALSILSKVYLQRENWQQALDYANQVIESGQYSLADNYEVIWREEGENGPGSIFEIQARGESTAHGIQQYSTTQGARGPSGWGWGFNTPTQDLVDAYDSEGDEIRKDATIIFAGETLWDGREVSPSIENPRYNEKAYSSANAGAGDGDKNMRIMRYAEVLLIKAEAANELGQTGEAQSALNQVRDRVDLDRVTTGDQNELREAIWKERRLELAFEHDRWFDLLRTGQAAEVMQGHGKNFVEGKHELFPIPEEQLRKTPQMEQNPNY
ncbi:RagB/SusD family nutrient uptake outer membrane protein [Fodinibius salsisoli]|uniref:RagB/SusD family nutrient uptake outer membrane protein n=1 Tax=Fodinibius salsisoli TaxID=2820877 RepID=A0ABT3PKT8_9BACT|nr:RagB/SusD family nutrient uptake outer membrane protein [Fodinibius salsisoli]MCW9706465.1 RagB/SusD family nutrient uptake outer membrane protein [Fodinibius salsisoli]